MTTATKIKKKKRTSHIQFKMADNKQRASKRIIEYYYESSEESIQDFGSDDSVADVDYVESESDHDTSSLGSDQVK